MKITDFGLWFRYGSRHKGYSWSTTIPKKRQFYFYYDGILLAFKTKSDQLELELKQSLPYRIKLNDEFLPKKDEFGTFFDLHRPLRVDDFEVVENPDYRANL